MSGLSDYLQRLNRDNWSLRRIAQEAERHGHSINHTTVRKYLNGTHGTPSAEVLEAFAAVFGVDVNDLRARAGRPGVGEPFDLGPEAARLSGPQREAIRHLVRVMLDDGLASHPVPDGATVEPEDTSKRTPPRDAFTLAARRAPRGRAEMDRAADVAGEESQDPPA